MCRIHLCVFALSCLALGTSARLYRTDIRLLPGRGSQLLDDINAINILLEEHAETMKVVHARKTFGNDLLIIVYESQPGPWWIAAHAAFTARGFHVTVTPLTSCSHLASEFNVNLQYTPAATVENNEINDFYEVEFYDKGVSQSAYHDELEKHFNDDAGLLGNGVVNTTCYFESGTLPIKLMYFAHAGTGDIPKIMHEVNLGTKASVTRRPVVSLRRVEGALQCPGRA